MKNKKLEIYQNYVKYAKALGPDAQAVDGGEQFLFQLCVVGVGVGSGFGTLATSPCP